MSTITLVNVSGVFTIQSGASVILDANNYINYDDDTGVLSSSTTLPVDNELFNYTSGFHLFDGTSVLVSIYDFKGNTVVYGAIAIVDGLFQRDTDAPEGIPFFKNLNFLVEIDQTTEEGYLLADSANNNLFTFVNNCHIVSNITTATPEIAGLIGSDFDNGSITNCSVTFEDGSVRPELATNKGAIVNSNCAGGTVSGYVYISNCFSTVHLGSGGGGIVGSNASRSITAGVINRMTIYSCYSTGDITGGGGGIVGSNLAGVITAGTGCIVTIESCFSTGDVISGNSGGITGADSAFANIATGTTILNIISCYSTGAVGAANHGGICGNDAGISTLGASTININGCYTLDGVAPVDGFATGIMVGTGSTVANIVSTENSMSLIMSGDASFQGRTALSNLTVFDTYSTYRCVTFGGESLLLNSFLDCDVWRSDPRCVDLFAPSLGFCGCPLNIANGIEWPQTQPGILVIQPVSDNIVKSRMCGANSVWAPVTTSECYASASDTCSSETGYKNATITISVLLGVALLILIAIYATKASMRSLAVRF